MPCRRGVTGVRPFLFSDRFRKRPELFSFFRPAFSAPAPQYNPRMKKLAHIWIGTSGYTYKHWIGIFYPEDLPAGRWFEFYAERFPTVELNVSFYRLPQRKAFEGWRRRAPADFNFFIKGSRFITHIKKMKDPVEPLRIFFENASALEEKMAGVLWQFPPNFRKNAERLEGFLEALELYSGTRHCFEFRHESWFDSEIAGILEKHAAIYCRADRRDFYDYVEIPDTADFVYIRRHGVTFSNSYTDEEIERDAREIAKWRKKGREVFIYYNNDGGGAALYDAFRLNAVLHGKKPDLGPLKEVLQYARAA